jgi:hypothetical protein
MKIKLEQIITPARIGLGWCHHEITVRRIGKGWNVRVFANGAINQEIRVYKKEHIRYAVADLLRWEDKCSNFSLMAMASRQRQNKSVDS